MQDVFTNLWLRREELTIRTNLKAYLFTAIRNKAYDYLEKQAVRQKYEMHTVYTQPVASDTTNHQMAYEELHALIEKQLTVLPETTRQVFQLSRVDGLPIPKIAQELQLSGKAMKHLRLRLTNLLVWVVVLSGFSLFS